jgi:hypothetical protein
MHGGGHSMAGREQLPLAAVPLLHRRTNRHLHINAIKVNNAWRYDTHQLMLQEIWDCTLERMYL